MELLRRERGGIKARVTLFARRLERLEGCADLAPAELHDLESRIGALPALLAQFDAKHDAILALMEGEDALVAEEAKREEFEALYFATMERAKALTRKHYAHAQSTPLSTTLPSFGLGPALGQVALPKISLPTFSGQRDAWLEFRDKFASLIHGANLAPVQKHHYLRACLSGEAALVVQGVPFDGESYPHAWELLCRRYDNRRILMHDHVRALFELERLPKESASGLRHLVDTFVKHMGTLDRLVEDGADLASFLLCFIMSSKFDAVTARDWEEGQSPAELPSLEYLIEFLRSKADILFALESKRGTDNAVAKSGLSDRRASKNTGLIAPSLARKQSQPRKHTLLVSGPAQGGTCGAIPACPACSGAHQLESCPQFLELPPSFRHAKVKEMSRCIICLRSGHRAAVCTASKCRTCGAGHHSLLHFGPPRAVARAPAQSEGHPGDAARASTSMLSSDCRSAYVFLSTALVNVLSSSGRPVVARALLDVGSQSNFMTSSFASKLGLPFVGANIDVNGFGLSRSSIKHSCHANFSSRCTGYRLSANFLVVPSITGSIPATTIDTSSFPIPDNFKLADPGFWKPGPIDLLLGAEHFYSLLCVGQVSLGRGMPTLQNSKLGWLMTGRAAGESQSTVCHVVRDALRRDLSKFWEIEEVLDSPVTEPDPLNEHFVATTSRNSDGRFVVSLPLVNPEQLGDSREIASRRFQHMERKLSRQPDLKAHYISFMREYAELGHMSLAPVSAVGTVYHLPHHAVVKESSRTTKVRVVFDASAKPSVGASLNECLRIGPNMQDELLSILLRFRVRDFVFSADIAKMYRQVLLTPEQRSLQTILWREDPSEPLRAYELNTVTYGMASSSYLAIRALIEVANGVRDPSVASRIRRDFYVDDLLSGADSVEEAKRLVHGIDSALREHCFELRQWTSNHPAVIEGIRAEDRATDVDLAELHDFPSRTLGLMWRSKPDVLQYQVDPYDRSAPVSKRTILSSISQIFDPLGLLSPCIIVAKMIIQQLWKADVGWDDPVPSQLHDEWLVLREALTSLNLVSIPRLALAPHRSRVELHGFADASSRAYGACFYVRCTDAFDRHSVALLCAKGKVAPLKTLTVPRLELCAAHLLSKLYDKLSRSLDVDFSAVYLWCDSTIALAWIRQCPSTLHVFVANRVAQIQGMTGGATWRHVPTADNPADAVSRGSSPSRLIDSSLWWSGPEWLRKSHDCWPSDAVAAVVDLPEMRSGIVALPACASPAPSFIDVARFSKLSRLVGTTPYLLRFVRNCRVPTQSRALSFVSVAERRRALDLLVRLEQSSSFADEIASLARGRAVAAGSSIASLSPFLDENGLLRVGGRLRKSSCAFSFRHPLLLPRSSHFVRLLFEHEHKALLHVGPLGLFNAIRQRYWPIAGRDLARRVVRSCVICFRAKPAAFAPIIGQLPDFRVREAPPFHHCGTDYAGPFTLKAWHGRGCKTYKAYVVVFVCMGTKAVHLELVTDLTSQAFVAALRRLTARRGKPAVIYSDNGTNFVGAARELRELAGFIQNESSKLVELADSEGIVWKFIPPRSPHFGGIWEAGVKSVKPHLKRVVGGQLLTYEEMLTLLVQIEAILNSRPLTPLSSSPSDLTPLTPAHFLVGRPLVAVADVDAAAGVFSLSRYQRTQAMAQDFWHRWRREYLHTLQQAAKWRRRDGRAGPEVGALALLVDDAAPPLAWRLGRIVELHPGDDGIVRVVSLRTSSGIVKRAVRRICPLPCADTIAEAPGGAEGADPAVGCSDVR